MGVVVDDGYAYVGAGPAGLCILDISNPSELTLVKYVPTNDASGVDKSGDYVYVGDGGSADETEGYFKEIDVSIPSAAYVIGSLSFATPARGHWIADVSIWGDYAYLTDPRTIVEVYVVNISDPAQPIHEATYKADYGDVIRIQTINDRAYVAAWDAGLFIVDISNPKNPQKIYREATGS
jgi:hypothetical protein